MKMAREFLGSGWKFPVNLEKTETGKVAASMYEEDISEAIIIILGTSKGDRVMQPDFGCDLDQFVFTTLNGQTKGMIEESVREALIMWEPRIEVKSVNVSQDETRYERVGISIDYIVRATNNEFNFVYPFYLKE
jgi:phage baseplate assembly protein W